MNESLKQLWEQEQPELSELAKQKDHPVEALAKGYGAFLERAKLKVMSEQSNARKRQCVGLLFNQEMNTVPLLSELPRAVLAKVVQQELPEEPKPEGIQLSKKLTWLIKLLRQPVLILVAMGVIAALALKQGDFVCMGLALLVLALLAVTDGFHIVLPTLEKPAAYAAAASIQAELLLNRLADNVDVLGKHIDNLFFLDDAGDDQKPERPDPKTLELIQELWEGSGAKDTDYCREQISSYAKVKGLKLTEYDGSNGALFTWMYTDGEEAQLCPAIQDREANTLVVRGKMISPREKR